MKKEQLFLTDWKRIFFGDTPPLFMLEVLMRTFFIYLVLVIAMRIFGKRLTGQISLIEMAIMLTMGAILAPAMQLADRGLLSGVIALLCALAVERGINYWGLKNNQAERVIQGKESVLVEDGILQLEKLRSNRISRVQVMSVLRSKNIYNVSKIHRLYVEACGLFSVYTRETNEPGLSTLMENDPDIHSIQQIVPDRLACKSCGNTAPATPKPGDCTVCKTNQWVTAYR
ncbi:DUF421 domain-containing protein [Larkinella insperata]|uniref:DUF421 domain-containing protein n=1 Tax=Larkinella insperata TaxID=332158 RepID=A0ABW3QCV9_9BACT